MTEVARSTRLGRISEVSAEDYPLPADTTGGDPIPAGDIDVLLTEASKARIGYAQMEVGDLNPSRRTRRMAGSYVVSGVVYGLVNVRTDGDRILCATLNEKKSTWDVETFESRF